MSLPVVVLGAGLSGLAAAAALAAAGIAVRVVEARPRIGGRVLTARRGQEGLDLGPAWVWPDHQPLLARRLRELDLATLPQFEGGDFLVEEQAALRRLAFPRRYSDARRLRGGMGMLVEALADRLPPGAIRLGSPVAGILLEPEPGLLLADGERIAGRAVVVALPPRLVARLAFAPALPDGLRRVLLSHPTWMAPHAKAIAIYDRPFWREAGLAGTSVSRRGPLAETVDLGAGEVHALAGFVGWPAAHRASAQADLDAALREQLARLFGPAASMPDELLVEDWSASPFTAAPEDLAGAAGHPEPGHPDLALPWHGGRLVFAGAETAAVSPGLVEGALAAGERAAATLARLLGSG